MIRLIKPNIEFRDVKKDINDIFDSGILSKGDYNRKFATLLKEYIGVKFSFLTTSATTALSLALKVLKIGEGDEVLISDFSFPATVNVVEDIGALPVFVDVDLNTFNMNPIDLNKKISPRTKAVIFVDTFGNPSNLQDVYSTCQKQGIFLIEDAACALGSNSGRSKCGSIADISCFSFHPRKIITTGEGGAIVTNNQIIAEEIDLKLNHGAVKMDFGPHFISYGYNYRMSEIQACMGYAQLKVIDNIIMSRKIIKNQYIQYLDKEFFQCQCIDNQSQSNEQSIVFKMPSNLLRNDLIKFLRANEIESTIGTYSLSNLSYYKNKYRSSLINSKKLEDSTITLPCYKDLPVKYVCNIIDKFIKSFS